MREIQTQLRMPPEAKDNFQTLARLNHRSFNAEFLAALETYLAADFPEDGIPPGFLSRGNMVASTVRIPGDVYQTITARAITNGRSVNSEMTAAVRWHMQQQTVE